MLYVYNLYAIHTAAALHGLLFFLPTLRDVSITSGVHCLRSAYSRTVWQYSPHALGMASSVNCQKSFPIAHRKVTCTSYHAHGVHVQFTKPHLCHAPTMRSHTPYTKPLRDEPTAKNGVESRHPVLSTRDTAMDLHSALISYNIFKWSFKTLLLWFLIPLLFTCKLSVLSSPSCESIPQRLNSIASKPRRLSRVGAHHRRTAK